MPDLPIVAAMDDNTALRTIAGLMDELLDVVSLDYTAPTGVEDIAVTDESSPVRDADPTSIKVVVINTGTKKVNVYEDGKLMATVYPDEGWSSDLAGVGEITAKCPVPDDVTAVAVSTYHRPPS